VIAGLRPFRGLAGTPIATWLSKPIHQPRSANVELAGGDLNAAASQVGYLNVASKPQSAPEILGVIPERKIEEI
jgi:hypothetical protein